MTQMVTDVTDDHAHHVASARKSLAA